MTAPEKPLHVRVAEALGWTRAHYRHESAEHACGDIMVPDPERMRWKGRAPGEMVIGEDCTTIPRFDTDWSATGPLIERLGLVVGEYAPGYREIAGGRWYAAKPVFGVASYADGVGVGDTPLTGVCKAVLALSEAGKLPRERA